MFLALTGLRRNEGGLLTRDQVNLELGILTISDTKNGDAHSLPITAVMRQILERRMAACEGKDKLFPDVALEHLAPMAMRAGAPDFMLHDLRKMLASIGEKAGVGDAVLRRILNHRAKRSDTLHRHYVQLTAQDIERQLEAVQGLIIDRWNSKTS